MLAFLLFAQVVVAAPARADSVYSSEALRELVAREALANHEPPSEFRGYGARVESELSFIQRDTLGREGAAEIEQIASAVRWSPGQEYDIHVVGYRTANIGVPYSALSIVGGWTVPSLYGERLQFGVDPVGGRRAYRSSADSAAGMAGPVIIAVHPFAADRDQFYRFSGGDTVTVLGAGGRRIPILRIRVTPHLVDTTRFAAFDGEIDLDATRWQIVRMRGQFVEYGEPVSRLAKIPGLIGVAFAEFVNAEFDGKYWLPAFQRTEFQATFALFGPGRAVFRIVSRFTDHAIDTGAVATDGDRGARSRHRLTFAPQDSVSRFGDWRLPLGDATSSVHADDFDDIGPDAWRKGGPPRMEFGPTKTDDIVRFDRIEGLYTGWEVTERFRDAMPGLAASGFVGWAWAERTVRGGARVSLDRAPWTLGARAERQLASTNDFAVPDDAGGGGLGALLASIDDADYVDRRVATLSATRVLGSLDRGLVTVQLGGGDDRAEVDRLSHGVFAWQTPFRPNRGVAQGSYALGVLDAELHPNVSGDFAEPGVGARLHVEAGAGTLTWQRAELSLSARRYWGPVALALHGDGGAVFGSAIPAQQLFELGGNAALPAYDYKEFAGDRAALVRGFASYTLPIWRTPRRVLGRFFLPGIAPGFGMGAQAGWTDLTSDAARVAVNELGVVNGLPVSRASDGVRGSAGLGVTFFSGAFHLGMARPIDHPGGWRFVLGFGESF
jgi:hypothetical protein